MARPVQLRYNDETNGETVIGTYLTNDNLINGGMLKNSGSGEYTRLEINGDKQLQENLETDYTNYGDAQNGESEPEILVYTYEKSSGDFILRDRVFAEDAGTIKDGGDYRNDNLWGFQKWVGRKRVSGISLSNATITDIINDLLPSGYVAKTPAEDSVPTIDNYSYTGSINGALRDLIRDYPIKIWFTAELDGNNDYIVKVQSKGFGGVIQTITFDNERQTEGYKINEFEPEDKSNIINKVEIVGKANDGSKIQVIESDSTSINQHGERYIKRNVGYVEDSTQATNLANSILSPDPSPHAELSIPFQEDNQLNGSVDILDNRYGIDAVYTIVKQRDFFTEGRTEVEVGFEKNRTEKRRNANRDLDERNNQLFPSDQTDVGNQNFEGETGAAPSDTGKTGDVDSDPSDTGKTGGVDAGFIRATPSVDEFLFERTISEGSQETWNFSSLNADVDSDPAFITLNLSATSVNIDLAIEVNITFGAGTNTYLNETFSTGFNGNLMTGIPIRTSFEEVTIENVDITIFNYSGQGDQDVSGTIQILAQNDHDHGDNIDTVDFDHPHGDDIDTVDFDHPHGDDIDTVDFDHGQGDLSTGHGTQGTTDAKNVNVSTEEKTDR